MLTLCNVRKNYATLKSIQTMHAGNIKQYSSTYHLYKTYHDWSRMSTCLTPDQTTMCMVLCVDQGFVIFYFVHMLLCLFALLNPCTVNIVLKSITGVPTYNVNTNEMCLYPDTYYISHDTVSRPLKQSGDVHQLTRYICSVVSLPITLALPSRESDDKHQ